MNHNLFNIILSILKNLGFKKFLIYSSVWTAEKLKKVCLKILTQFSPNYSVKYCNNSELCTNNLFDYSKLKTFPFSERNSLLKNKIKIFSNQPSDFSLHKKQYYKTHRKIYYFQKNYLETICGYMRKYYKKNFSFPNWYYDCFKNANYPGVKKVFYDQGFDIKIPWEISRFQHLNKLCNFAKINKLDKDYDFVKAQVMNFIYIIPPGTGIHWFNAMEVAIRGSNIAMITDILISENKLHGEEKQIFLNSIHDHLMFVLNHLEWSPLSRNNHYLANIVGMMVMSYFLPKNKKLESIMNFSAQQLLNEIDFQFYNDGSLKEGSTAYHVLSSEMVLIGIYFYKKIMSKNIKYESDYGSTFGRLFKKESFIYFYSKNIDKNFEKKMFNKVIKIFSFSKVLSRNDGTLLQVGDNDSGCFFDLDFSNNSLERKKLHILLSKPKKGSLYFLIKSNIGSSFFNKKFLKLGNENNTQEKTYKKKDSMTFKIPFSKNINKRNIQCFSFENFGLYCYIHKYFSLYIICKENFDYQNSGHHHDDNLSVDLVVGKKSIITDPGSYCYSSNLSLREKYRSIKSHFAPRPKSNYYQQIKYPFVFRNFVKAKNIMFSRDLFLGKICYDHTTVFRSIRINKSGIDINDFSDYEELSSYQIFKNKAKVSSSYRVLSKANIIQLNK